jgi:hypothetical protein
MERRVSCEKWRRVVDLEEYILFDKKKKFEIEIGGES